MDETSRTVRLLLRPSVPRVLLAALAFQQSLTPSLLLRSWYFQGVVTGVAAALGYGLGALVGWGAGRAGEAAGLEWRLPTRHRVVIRSALLVGVVVLLVASSRAALEAHRWTWDRLGHEPGSTWRLVLGTLAVALVVAVLLLATAWLLRLVVRWIGDRLARAGGRLLPRWVAGVLAAVLVAYAVLAAANSWVYQRSLSALNEAFTLSDLEVEDSPARTTSQLRSGGPASEVQWEDLGDEGRRFVTRGASSEQLAEVAEGGPVVEPVRVFVGRATTDDADERAALAVEELTRFGGFERRAVLVVVPTGTGWINEQIVRPVELLHGGDVATVAMQYSHLPSPLAFLAEAQAAGDAGRALVSAVRERIDALEGGERPLLLVAGESLGSFGGSEAYATIDDLVEQADASLWVGPPPMMHLRREAERDRAPGSPQVKPVLGDGSEVLFANRASDITGRPRTVFLQQGDDPIVWWDWGTLWREPDWLEEPLDPAVNPAMEWYPVTTFLNLAVDMAVSTTFEEEQGHMYGTKPLLAWVAMLQPEGWDDGRVEELRERLTPVGR